MIDPKKKLWKWGPIDGHILYIDYFMEDMKRCKEKLGITWSDAYVHIRDGKVLFVSEYDALYANGEKMFRKYILDDKLRKKYFDIWETGIKDKLIAKLKSVDEEYMSKLSDDELAKLLEEFNELYDNFWAYGLLPEIANFGGEKLLHEAIDKKHAKSYIEIFEVLATPDELSFYQIEELDLLKIKLSDDIENDLIKHQEKYYWIQNSYGGTRIKTVEEFREELDAISVDEAKEKIKKIKNYTKEVAEKKRKIVEKYNLNEDIQNLARKLSFSIWWQDYRKQFIFMILPSLTLFGKEFGKRHNVPFEDMLLYSRNNIIDISKGKILDDISNRKIGYMSYANEEEGYFKWYSGQKANDLISKYTDITVEKDVNEFKGVVVSTGKVTGKVKLLSGARHFDSFKEGEILVTSMTSPEFILAMRKAAAIITDEGGITSHAAIVSRELKIPCIVGTKIATRVLSNGDLVEVDADKGVVRKI